MRITVKVDRDKLMKLAKDKKEQLDEAIAEAIEDTSGRAEIQQGYDESQLEIRTSQLYNSFQVEKRRLSLRVYSTIIYSRIQDLGGWAGRNHASYIPPTKYFTNGAKILKDKFMKTLKDKIKKIKQ